MTRKLSEIIKQWEAVQNTKLTSVPEWCWSRPFANEPYYSFMHWLVPIMNASVVVELGVDTGTSSVFLATALPQAKIISVELDLASVNNLKTMAAQHNLTNLTIIHGSSLAAETVDQIKTFGKVDLLFIDTVHTFDQASAEYKMHAPLMATDGIIMHDDIKYEPSMLKYWETIPEPKYEMPKLHWTDFGLSGGSI